MGAPLVGAADLLHSALRRQDLTQEQLARHTGYSQKHVSQVLTGKARFSPEFAAACEMYIRHDDLAAKMLVAQARLDAVEAKAARGEAVRNG